MSKLPENSISSLDESFIGDHVNELSLCADPDYGFLYFAERYAQTLHPSDGLTSFKLIDMQKEMLANIHNNQFSINMVARQSGKTLCAAVYLLWSALFKPDQTIMITANKLYSAQDILSTMMVIYDNCPSWLVPNLVKRQRSLLSFNNGATIIAEPLSTTTGRGRTVNILFCDEFAYVDPRTAESFLHSLTPALPTNGKIILSSTPNNPSDAFMKIWNDDTMFSHFKATWETMPDRDAAWKNTTVERMGLTAFKREFECNIS